MKRTSRDFTTLTFVREIGFDTEMRVGSQTKEQIFFLGPTLGAERSEGGVATEEAIREFIDNWENQIRVAKGYLANGCNNKTEEWKMTTDADKNATYNPAAIHYNHMRTLGRLKHTDYRQAREVEWKTKTANDHLDEYMGSDEFAKMSAADFAQYYLGLVKKADDAAAAVGALCVKYDAEFDAANKHLLEG